jgi:hypothetical protein
MNRSGRFAEVSRSSSPCAFDPPGSCGTAGLKAFRFGRGFEIVQTFFENVSAVKARPEFDKMIASVHRGKFDVHLV